MAAADERAVVDRAARSWFLTPYHDCAQIKGHGVDCGMLLRAVYVEAGLIKNFEIAPYSPQHYLHRSDEHYLGYVQRFAHEIDKAKVGVGDIVLWKIGKCFGHGAIVVSPGWPAIIHAHSPTRKVRFGNGESPHLGLPIKAVKFFSLW